MFVPSNHTIRDVNRLCYTDLYVARFSPLLYLSAYLMGKKIFGISCCYACIEFLGTLLHYSQMEKEPKSHDLENLTATSCCCLLTFSRELNIYNYCHCIVGKRLRSPAFLICIDY